MIAECPKCEGSLEYEYPAGKWGFRDDPLAFKCEECRARFEIEEDADYNGENYVDCSTAGKEIR